MLVLRMDHGRQTKMVRHLPERVLRQYEYVQTVLRSPTMILPLAPADVAVTFLEIVMHVVSQQERGHQVRTTSLGSIQISTLGGSIVYHILSSSTLLQSLTLSCRDLSTMIFLLTRSGPNILLIHCRSSIA